MSSLTLFDRGGSEPGDLASPDTRARGWRRLGALLSLAVLSSLVAIVGMPGAASAAPAGAFRALDTRPDWKPLDNATKCFDVTGRGNVPATAKAVAINLTVVGAAGPGYATAYAAGTALPGTSSINYSTDVIASNAIVNVGSGGQICVYTLRSADLVVDVTGWFTAAQFVGTGSFRAYDSRTAGTGVRPSSGSTRCVSVVGQKGVPTNAFAVSVSITAIQPTAAGYLTAYAQGQTRPNASNVNYTTGQVIANGGVVRVGNGQICIYTLAASHYTVDVTGSFGPGTGIGVLGGASRVLDTRLSGGAVAANTTRCFSVRSAVSSPSATAVFLNQTVVSPQAPGYATLHSPGSTRPATSSINFSAGDVRANGALAPIDANGNVCIFSSATAHYVIDIQGYDINGTRIALTRQQVAIDFGLSQRGSVYVGGCAPSRFGGAISEDGWYKGSCVGQSNYFQSVDRIGYDCSGLIWRMAREAGLSTFTADSTLDFKSLEEVTKSLTSMRPGDLLVIRTEDSKHVVMYIGKFKGVESVIEATVETGAYTETTRDGFVYRVNAGPGVRVAPLGDRLTNDDWTAHRIPWV